MKVCKKCGVERPESEFFSCKQSADGLQYECRRCSCERGKVARLRCKALGLLTYSQRGQQRLKREVLNAYSGGNPKCSCCGESHIEFLAIDHVEGGGSKHRKSLKPGGLLGTGFYQWLKRNNFPKGFRVLCHNCNHSFGAYGYCPHQNPERTPDINAIRIVPQKTHCRRGHPFTPENLLATKDGARRCKICSNQRHKELHRKERLAAGIKPAVGENHFNHKLTANQVREMRASNEPSKVLAVKYGIKPVTVYKIRTRRLWKHLE